MMKTSKRNLVPFLFCLIFLGACKVNPDDSRKTQKRIIGTWEFVNVDDGPENLRYPKSVYEINADSTCSQRIGDNFRKGNWLWNKQEDALVMYFEQGEPRAVYILEVKGKKMVWQRVNEKHHVTFTRLKKG